MSQRRSLQGLDNIATDGAAGFETLEKIVQWNLDLTKSLGTGQICSLNRGFIILKTSI